MSETVAHLLAHVTCASQPGLASHGSAVVVPDLKAIASVEESEGSLCSAQAKHMRTRLCRAKRNLITPQALNS